MPKKEVDLTSELVALIHQRCPSLVALRHADRYTTGIPDLSVSNRRNQTVWIEMKRFEAAHRLITDSRLWVKSADLLQLDLAARLGAMYLVMDCATGRYLYVRATRVYRDVHAQEAIKPRELELPEALLLHPDRRVIYDHVITTLLHHLYQSQGEA